MQAFLTNNTLYSAVTLLICTFSYLLSWYYYSKLRFLRALIFLIVSGLILRIFTASDFFLHAWDERFHALVAKNLIKHPLIPTLYDIPILNYDYKNWAENHIWLHKQPFPLWAIAGSIWIFGVNEMAVRLPSILLSTTGIWLTFYIGNYFYNKKTGFLAAFLFSINGLIIELTAGRAATDHIDVFFLFWIEVAIAFSILFVQKQKTIYNIIAGISIGFAILTKWLPALIVIPIWILIIWDSKKFNLMELCMQFLILLFTCLIIFLPWQLYIFHSFPQEAHWEYYFNYKHLIEVIEIQQEPFYFFLDRIRINYGELIYIPLSWFLWKSIKRIQNKKQLALFIWIMIPLLFFSIAKTKMQGYILFVSPALFIINSHFFFLIIRYKRKFNYQWLFNLTLILFVLLPVRYMIERIKPFEKKNRQPIWTKELRKLNNRNISKGVLFNYNKPIEAMFYTNLVVYSRIPEKEKINDLVYRGYTVIINDDGCLSEDVRDIKGVKIEKLRCDE